MHFVTMKRDGYAFFATTPSGRAGIGVTEDQQRVALLFRRQQDFDTVRVWAVTEFSHTDLLLKLGAVDEPGDPADLLDLLPRPRSLS